jgi:GAF domain-containing protein
MKRTEYQTKQTRWLTAIQSLGNQLQNQDRGTIAQNTADSLSNTLGFGQVEIYLIDKDDSARPQLVAQTHAGAPAPRFPPLLECRYWIENKDQEHCRLVPTPDTRADLSEPGKPVRWHDRDWIYAPIAAGRLLGYAALACPRDKLRPTRDMLQVIDTMAGQAAMALHNAERCASADPLLDKRLAELTTLLEIGRQINAQLDIGQVVQITLDWAMHTTCAISGTISLLEETEASETADTNLEQANAQVEPSEKQPVQRPNQGRQVLRVIAQQGYPSKIAKYWCIDWPIHSSLVEQVMQTGEAAGIDAVAHTRDDVCQTVGPLSYLAIPMKRDDTIVGVIGLESIMPKGFTADQIAVLSGMADQAAIAIGNARVYEQTTRRIAEFESLQTSSLDIVSSLQLEVVLDSIVTHSHSLAGADHVGLYLYDECREGLHEQTRFSSRGEEDHFLAPAIVDQIVQEVAHTGKTRVVHHNRGPSRPTSEASHITAIACIPIVRSVRMLGVLCVAFQERCTLTPDTLQVLHHLANQAAVAIDNAQLYAAVQHANNVKNEFVCAASQEFKVPMTSIQGYARLIALQESGPITEKQKTYLDIIQKNIRRMNTLVDDLIGLSNSEPG